MLITQGLNVSLNKINANQVVMGNAGGGGSGGASGGTVIAQFSPGMTLTECVRILQEQVNEQAELIKKLQNDFQNYIILEK